LVIGAAILVTAIVITGLIGIVGSGQDTANKADAASTSNPLLEQLAESKGEYLVASGNTNYYEYTGSATTLSDLADSGSNVSVCIGNDCDDDTIVSSGDTISVTSVEGNGTIPKTNLSLSEAPLFISSCAELNSITNMSGNYFLTQDIDCTGVAFSPKGTSSAPFTGIFDGGKHKITNLAITSNAQYTALFSYTNGATIKKLGIESGNINGGTYASSLIGSATNTTIANCYNKANIVTNRETSGLVNSLNNSSIINSFNSGNIYGPGATYLGGLVYSMTNNSSVINSLNAPSTIGSASYKGGLSYSCYTPGSISNSYFNSARYSVCVMSNTCTLTNCTGITISNMYASTHAVYNGSPAWDPNIWQWSGSALPTFKN